MLTIDEKIRISKEAALGVEPTITTPEALEHRQLADKEIAAMNAKGIAVDLPYEL